MPRSAKAASLLKSAESIKLGSTKPGSALAFKLASEGIVTREDLAELATDDLLEINEMDQDDAAALIMKARAHWFEEEQQA